ncbi:MAG: hypothetical protein AAGA68_05715 [Pseudomonadota bacterium]
MDESLWSLFDAWERVLEQTYASQRLRAPGPRRSERTGRPLAVPTSLITLESLMGNVSRSGVGGAARRAVLDVTATDEWDLD